MTTPLWSKYGIDLYHGSAMDVLPELPRRSVQSIVTSPPYWGLRSYSGAADAKPAADEIGSEWVPDCGIAGSQRCGKCYVCHMVELGQYVRRVLRDDGTFWLNLGDTYGKNGDLIGVPWRVALALQADGWVLRQEVIWHKPSPMPESVKNRCTRAHEQVFMFTKNRTYYYDHVAIKEEGSETSLAGEYKNDSYQKKCGSRNDGGSKTLAKPAGDDGRNKRSVWSVDDERALLDWLAANEPDALARFMTDVLNKPDVWKIAPQPYPGAHFATFPPNLVLPMILAGTSERGACPQCGAPWERIVKEEKLKRERPNEHVKRTGEEGTGNSCANTVAGVKVTTLGWGPTCGCGHKDAVPCVVLDPFCGSGTTPAVCRQFNRHCRGVELYEKYIREHQIPRIEATPPTGFRDLVKPRVAKDIKGLLP
jgi:DNA modification methylase